MCHWSSGFILWVETAATERFQNDPEAQSALADPVLLDQVNVDNFDALFFPGGHGPMWDLASSNPTALLVESFYTQGKVIGAVCHGPAALVRAKTSQGEPIFKGKRLTAFTNAEEAAVTLDQIVPFALETRLKDLGGEFSQGGRIPTSRCYGWHSGNRSKSPLFSSNR